MQPTTIVDCGNVLARRAPSGTDGEPLSPIREALERDQVLLRLARQLRPLSLRKLWRLESFLSGLWREAEDDR